jgi:hypothetical protein
VLCEELAGMSGRDLATVNTIITVASWPKICEQQAMGSCPDLVTVDAIGTQLAKIICIIYIRSWPGPGSHPVLSTNSGSMPNFSRSFSDLEAINTIITVIANWPKFCK